MAGGARTDKQLRGDAGEERALDYLQSQGLMLVERNFRCKAGEIDLVMREGEGLVFVEVRRRGSRDFGGAAASITAAKQRRIVLAAQFYLQKFRVMPACRIDVVAIDGGQIEWIRNAI